MNKTTYHSRDFFKVIKESLEEGPVKFTISGKSMWPLLLNNRDQVIISKGNRDNIKKGDIVLFNISENHYILHRVTYIEDNYFETTGDGNFTRDGKLPKIIIIAKVDKIIRKNKVIDCQSKSYQLYSHLWMMLYPIRPLLFKIWFKIRKYFRK